MSHDRITFTIGKTLWLTSNRPISNRGYLQRVRNELHQMAAFEAQRQGLARWSAPVLACWTVRYPKGVRADKGEASNAQPTTKALLDGLVQAGYLPDDGPHWVTAEHFRRGNNLTEPSIHQIELLLTDQAVPF